MSQSERAIALAALAPPKAEQASIQPARLLQPSLAGASWLELASGYSGLAKALGV